MIRAFHPIISGDRALEIIPHKNPNNNIEYNPSYNPRNTSIITGSSGAISKMDIAGEINISHPDTKNKSIMTKMRFFINPLH
jgi:hypothetical protein